MQHASNGGDDWRMPAEEELYELLRDCLWQWFTINGVNGYKVIGPNGNSIFLPAAGTSDPEYPEYNECGWYWTGSFSDEDCHWDALCLNLTMMNSDITALTHIHTKVLQFGQ